MNVTEKERVFAREKGSERERERGGKRTKKEREREKEGKKTKR